MVDVNGGSEAMSGELGNAPISERIEVLPYFDGRCSVKVDGQEIGGWISSDGGVNVHVERDAFTKVTVTLSAREVIVHPLIK